MWQQFYFENLHFGLYLFVCLVMLCVFWLYLDSWKEKKISGSLFCFIGFFLLAVSFFLRANYVESSVIDTTFFSKFIQKDLYLILKNISYLLILAGVLVDRFQKKPEYLSQVMVLSAQSQVGIPVLYYVSPVLTFLISLMYFAKAIIGLEKHLLPLFFAFFSLTVYEVLSLRYLFLSTNDIDIYNLVAPYGLIWILQHVFLSIFVLIVARWVFGYLLKQFEPQLIIIMNSFVLVIFLIVTVVFTGILIRNIENQNLDELASHVSILKMSLESKRSEAVSDAEVIAQNPQVVETLSSDDRSGLADLMEDYVIAKRYDTLVIVTDTGEVVARGEDRSKIGDGLSGDRLIKDALQGNSLSTFSTKDGVIAPDIFINAVAPIYLEEKIIGAVFMGVVVDNTFVLDVKSQTGLDVSLYADNKISSTSILGLDNKSTVVGLLQDNEKINRTVLRQAKNYKTDISVGGRKYLAAFTPLLDTDNIPVGMVFVGRQQTELLHTVSRAMEFTFLATSVLLILSTIPAVFVARYISKQIK